MRVAPPTRIKGKMALDDGTDLVRETDDHKDTNDACATFNWRWIFPVKIPCRDTKFVLEVTDGGYFTSDLIGSVTLDLDRDFALGKRTGAEVVLPLGKVKVSHPDVPGQVRGVIELQGILLHSLEAQQRPVGEGREEPNEDPRVNPDDPHLLKGRVTVAEVLFDSVADGAFTLWNWGKYTLQMKMLIGVASTLVAGIPTVIWMIMQFSGSDSSGAVQSQSAG